MKRQYRKAYNQLLALGVPVSDEQFASDAPFVIYVESSTWANYWDKSWGMFGISHKVHDILRANGLFAEWANPELINCWES